MEVWRWAFGWLCLAGLYVWVRMLARGLARSGLLAVYEDGMVDDGISSLIF